MDSAVLPSVWIAQQNTECECARPHRATPAPTPAPYINSALVHVARGVKRSCVVRTALGHTRAHSSIIFMPATVIWTGRVFFVCVHEHLALSCDEGSFCRSEIGTLRSGNTNTHTRTKTLANSDSGNQAVDSCCCWFWSPPGRRNNMQQEASELCLSLRFSSEEADLDSDVWSPDQDFSCCWPRLRPGRLVFTDPSVDFWSDRGVGSCHFWGVCATDQRDVNAQGKTNGDKTTQIVTIKRNEWSSPPLLVCGSSCLAESVTQIKKETVFCFFLLFERRSQEGK